MKGLSPRYAEGIVKEAIKGTLSTGQAAARLGCTKQYVNKLKRRYAAEGAGCFANGNSGKARKWRTPKETEEAIIALYSGKYGGLNFSHFLEKLNEDEGIKIGYRPLYRILTAAGVSSPKRQRKGKKENAHPTRPRRKGFGELVQIDASLHPWFGPGLPKATLHGGIDDATGTVMGLRFDGEETLAGYYGMLGQILGKYGIPEAFYADRRTIFEYRKLPERDRTPDRDVHVQFARCCQQLGISIITTSVSQAKGRIERLWGTLQSRLVSELAIRGIKTIASANAYLPEFMADFNRRFAAEPDMETSLFAPAPSPKEIDFYLSVRYERRLDNGCSFAMLGKRLQMCDGDGRTLKAVPGSEVDVYVTLSGQILAVCDGSIAEVKDAALEPKEARPKKPGRPKWRPGPNHPWRRFVVSCKKGRN
jgi:transposase